MSANSALEEVYGILRNSYSDVIEDGKRNDSDLDRKKYDDHDDHYDGEEEVWRILDFSIWSIHYQSPTMSVGEKRPESPLNHRPF